jgi:hypothetical protein
MVGRSQKSLGAKSELNSLFGLEKGIGGTPLEYPPWDSTPIFYRLQESL